MAEYTPAIPVWIQLPCHPAEGMIQQFLPGMPGWSSKEGRAVIQTDQPTFQDEMLLFYEEYFSVMGGKQSLDHSRFALTSDMAPGFFELISYINGLPSLPAAVKGQVTGPFTFATSVKDPEGRAIFYQPELRDISVKLLAAKAAWQARQLQAYGIPVMIFLDEPGLAGFGTSAFISVTKEDIQSSLGEVAAAVVQAGGLAGIHVCANTDWALILELPMDIVSFDAYSFFDRFILFGKEIKAFLMRGGILSWGIVPTGNIQWVEQTDADTLYERLLDQIHQVAALGLNPEFIVSQSIITPSCGAGSLPPAHALKVIHMTQEISKKIRYDFLKERHV